MIRSSLLILLCVLNAASVAQFRDAGLWADMSLNREYGKKWQLGIAPEIRLNENLSRVSRFFADFEAQYKFSKSVFFTAVYRQGFSNTDGFLEPRQRLLTGVLLRHKIDNFTASWTTRWQAAIQQPGSESDADFVTTWRNKFQLKYGGLKKTDIAASFEFFNSSSLYGALQLQSWRAIFSAERKLNKRSSFTLGYLIQKSLRDSPQEIDFVVLASFSRQLKSGRKKQQAPETTIPQGS